MTLWLRCIPSSRIAFATFQSAVLGKSEGEGTEWHGHVSALTVAPEYRRHGAARQLMHDFEARWDKAYVRCRTFLSSY